MAWSWRVSASNEPSGEPETDDEDCDDGTFAKGTKDDAVDVAVQAPSSAGKRPSRRAQGTKRAARSCSGSRKSTRTKRPPSF